MVDGVFMAYGLFKCRYMGSLCAYQQQGLGQESSHVSVYAFSLSRSA